MKDLSLNIYLYLTKNIYLMLLIFFFIVISIINNHVANKLVKELNEKSKELKFLRWEYLTQKSELMYKGKLTEVLPNAQKVGLQQIIEPPYKITLKSKDYQQQE